MTPDEILQVIIDRKRAYQMALTGPAGKAVFDDLAFFCRARETCVVPGSRDQTYLAEGRREVYLRIQDHLDLTPDELMERYTRPA